ncbi:lipopolysaccharide biosynthesis protein [Aeoliella mucimassa]|uniref:Polysaccharide biosynthesis protein n=1 Tax=Aeoliella mucimassa TaxID=2527972 RepID=A0A518ALT7_9BACT|nr:oligosaccharide flippase family protein [Aeoliella mucimassa]QDU55685.1 Polysaccharide biosynthesis protein [Aeoliella mucimassa]
MPAPKVRSFLSNAAMYGIGTILLQAASLVLLPLYLNYLTPEEYGVLEILNQVGTFVVIGLMANGLRMATLTFYQQARNAREEQAVSSTTIVCVTSLILIGCLLSFASAPPLAQWLGLQQSSILVLGVITVLLEAIIIVPMALMQARIESVRFVSVSLAMFLFRVGLTIVLVSVMGLGLWGILIGRSLVAVLFGGYLNWRELRLSKLQFSWDITRQITAFALPFLPGGLLAFFINSGDRFYLIRYAGEYEVGVYSLSYKMAMAVGTFAFIPLYKVWSAQMYDAATKPDAPEHFGKVFTYFITSLISLGLAVTLFAENLINALGGNDYVDAVEVLPLLVMAIVLMSASNLMDSGLYITRTTKYKPLIFAWTGIVIFLGYSLLIPNHGATGAAWATLIGFAAHVGLTWIISQKLFYVKYEHLRVGLLLVSSAGCWWLSHELETWKYPELARLLLYLTWLALVYSCATRSERKWITNNIRRIALIGWKPKLEVSPTTSID